VKVAVAGGRGFVGRALMPRLLHDHTATVWDLPEVNLLDTASLAGAFERFKPDLVVNLAAILGGMGSANLGEIFTVNFCGNLNLVEACVRHGVQRYVFASSLTVHGSNPIAAPCRLSTPFNPKHAYGASKAAAEYSLMQYAAHRGMTVVTLRPSLILGDTPVKHAPIDFLQTLVAGRAIELFGSGAHEREWVWIADAAAGFSRAVDFCARSEAGYHPFFR
jgi:nucleoside-diphosphate-sugar epimerase